MTFRPVKADDMSLNWKKALERLSKHEESNAHSEAVFKVDSVFTTNVGATLDCSLKQQQIV